VGEVWNWEAVDVDKVVACEVVDETAVVDNTDELVDRVGKVGAGATDIHVVASVDKPETTKLGVAK
jgi:hypothetical protein